MSLHTQDPDYTGWSGELQYYYELGQGAVVHITATIDDDETTDHKVMFEGVDIAGTLTDETISGIERWQADHWRELVRKAEERAQAAMEPA